MAARKGIRLKWIIIAAVAIAIIGFMIGSSSGENFNSNVAIIPVKGVISVDAGAGFFDSGFVSSTDTVRFIERADKDDNIKVILLEINSPGGSAVASEEIARAIENVDKPVVSWIREAGASGAYWIASESDWIIASRMSITGSVGVVASYLEFGQFFEDHNITYRQLTGGEHKAIGDPFGELTAEQESLIQDKIDRIHVFFLDDVQENRGLNDETMDEVDSGIYFLGIEAYELGLIDELGGRDEVKAWLNQTLEGEEPKYFRYEKSKSFFEELASARVNLNPGLQIRS